MIKLFKTDEIGSKIGALFESKKQKLAQLLQGAGIEHIGGTAVPGSISRGDLDINIRVRPEDFEGAIETLKKLYQINQPENWSWGFASLKDDLRRLGIQVTIIDSPEDYFVAQREYLKRHPESLSELNALKENFKDGSMNEYREAKRRFFEHLDRNRVAEDVSKYDVRKALIVPINAKRQILIQDRRGHKKPDWGYFGGSVETGETSLEAVIRESKEELDVNIRPEELIYLGISTTAWENHKMIRYMYLYPTDRKEFTVLEGKGAHWLTFDEVRKRLEDEDRFNEIAKRIDMALSAKRRK